MEFLISMMLRLIFNQFKVFNPIIKFITIKMVNYFFGSKISTKFFFHYQSVFSNVSNTICKRMLRYKDHFITTMIDYPTTFKIISSFSGWKSFYITLSTQTSFIASFFFSWTRKFSFLTASRAVFNNHYLKYRLGGS